VPYRVLSFPETSSSEETAVLLADLDQLGSSAGEVGMSVALVFEEQTRINTKVLTWIDSWKKRLSEKELDFCIVAKNPDQQESIELSHPDQTLFCFSSIEELKKLRKAEMEGESETSIPGKAEEPEEMPPAVKRGKSLLYSPGEMVEATGEYTCSSCGDKRMILKGDLFKKCANENCQNPMTGWELTFHLF
jgi:hypothetical protein